MAKVQTSGAFKHLKNPVHNIHNFIPWGYYSPEENHFACEHHRSLEYGSNHCNSFGTKENEYRDQGIFSVTLKYLGKLAKIWL